MRRFALVLIAVLAIVAAPDVNGAQEPIRVLIDGDPVSFDVAPLEIQGRVLVPLRGVFERLGARVEYDAGLRTIVVVRDQTIIQLGLGRREVTINGRRSTLDVPAVSISGRTLVPLRFVSEALGASVQWEADTRTVSIVTAGAGGAPGGSAGGTLPTPRPGAGQQTISGILLSVNASQSRLTVQQANGPVTITVTPDTTILRTNVENNQGGSARLAELRPGDAVQATVDVNLRAISLRSTYRTHSGRIDAVTAQTIVLDNGSAFRVSPNAEVIVDGRSAQVLDLRRGMTVTVRTPPQQNEIWTVEARSAAAPSPGATASPPAPSTPAASPTPGAEPRVSGLQVSPSEPLRAGQTLTVTLRGTRGGRAAFSIGDAIADVAMREQQPGEYVGTYTVKPGDTATNVPVLARVIIAGVSSPVLQSAANVTIDTTAPRVAEVVPAAGARVTTNRPNFVVVADDGGGSGIASIRLIVRGQDVTNQAQRSDRVLSYTPPQPFAEGTVTAQAIVSDRAGNTTSQPWSFEVDTRRGGTPTDAPIAAPPGRPASPVITDPAPGEQVSSPFTVRGRAQPGTRVRIVVNVDSTIGGVAVVRSRVAETEVQTNRNGGWSAAVSYPSLMGGGRAQISAVAVGAGNETSDPAMLEVRLRRP